MESRRTTERDPIADTAFDLGEAFERAGVRATATNLEADPFRIARGEVEPAEPIRFVRSSGKRLYDLVGTTHVALILVSPRFLETLERGGFTGWSLYDVELADGLEQAVGYRGLAITGRCGSIDDTLSEEILVPPKGRGGETSIAMLGSFFEAGSWDGSSLFTPPDRASIWVVAEVKEALQQAGITGIRFERLAEIERLVLEEDDFDDDDDL